MTLLASKANLGLTGVEATVHHYGAVASAYEIAGKWQKALQLMDRVHQPNQVVRVVLIWMSLVLHIFSFCLILCTQPDYHRIMCLYGFNYTYGDMCFCTCKIHQDVDNEILTCQETRQTCNLSKNLSISSPPLKSFVAARNFWAPSSAPVKKSSRWEVCMHILNAMEHQHGVTPVA